MNFRFNLFFFAFTICSAAIASDICPEPGWVETGKVQRVEVSSDEALLVKFDWSDKPVVICSLAGSNGTPNPASATTCKSWMAQALSAQALGKNLKLKHTQAACFRGWDGLINDVLSVYIE